MSAALPTALTLSGWHRLFGLTSFCATESDTQSSSTSEMGDSVNVNRENVLIVKDFHGQLLTIDANAINDQRLIDYGLDLLLAAEDLHRAQVALNDIAQFHAKTIPCHVAPELTQSLSPNNADSCSLLREATSVSLNATANAKLAPQELKNRLLQLLVGLCVHHRVEYLQGTLHILIALCYLTPCPLYDLASAFQFFDCFLCITCPHIWLPQNALDDKNQCHIQKHLCIMFHQLLQFHFPRVAFSLDRFFYTAYWNLHWFESLGVKCFTNVLAWIHTWFSLLTLFFSRITDSEKFQPLLFRAIKNPKTQSNNLQRDEKSADPPYCPQGPYPEWMFFILSVTDYFTNQLLHCQPDSDMASIGEQVAQLLSGVHGSDTLAPWDTVALGPQASGQCAEAMQSHHNTLPTVARCLNTKPCSNNALTCEPRPWSSSFIRFAAHTPRAWLKRLATLLCLEPNDVNSNTGNEAASFYGLPVYADELKHVQADTFLPTFTPNASVRPPSTAAPDFRTIPTKPPDFSNVSTAPSLENCTEVVDSTLTGSAALAESASFYSPPAQHILERILDDLSNNERGNPQPENKGLAKTGDEQKKDPHHIGATVSDVSAYASFATLTHLWKERLCAGKTDGMYTQKRSADSCVAIRTRVILIVPFENLVGTSTSPAAIETTAALQRSNRYDQNINYFTQNDALILTPPILQSSSRNARASIQELRKLDPEECGQFGDLTSGSFKQFECFLSDSLNTTIAVLRDICAFGDPAVFIVSISTRNSPPMEDNALKKVNPLQSPFVKDGVVQILTSVAKGENPAHWYTYTPPLPQDGTHIFLRLIESDLPHVAVCPDLPVNFFPTNVTTSATEQSGKTNVVRLQDLKQAPKRLFTNSLFFRRRVNQNAGKRNAEPIDVSNVAKQPEPASIEPCSVIPNPARPPPTTSAPAAYIRSPQPPITQSSSDKTPIPMRASPSRNGTYQRPLFVRRKTSRPTTYLQNQKMAETFSLSTSPTHDTRFTATAVSTFPSVPERDATPTMWNWIQSFFSNQNQLPANASIVSHDVDLITKNSKMAPLPVSKNDDTVPDLSPSPTLRSQTQQLSPPQKPFSGKSSSTLSAALQSQSKWKCNRQPKKHPAAKTAGLKNNSLPTCSHTSAQRFSFVKKSARERLRYQHRFRRPIKNSRLQLRRTATRVFPSPSPSHVPAQKNYLHERVMQEKKPSPSCETPRPLRSTSCPPTDITVSPITPISGIVSSSIPTTKFFQPAYGGHALPLHAMQPQPFSQNHADNSKTAPDKPFTSPLSYVKKTKATNVNKRKKRYALHCTPLTPQTNSVSADPTSAWWKATTLFPHSPAAVHFSPSQPLSHCFFRAHPQANPHETETLDSAAFSQLQLPRFTTFQTTVAPALYGRSSTTSALCTLKSPSVINPDQALDTWWPAEEPFSAHLDPSFSSQTNCFLNSENNDTQPRTFRRPHSYKFITALEKFLKKRIQRGMHPSSALSSVRFSRRPQRKQKARAPSVAFSLKSTTSSIS